MPELQYQSSLFEVQCEGYEVRQIQAKETHYFLLNIHYAKRLPPIMHAFGLFQDGSLVGVITYGMPPSPALCKGVCGQQWKDHVLELNRLCLLNNKANEASRLVAGSLKMLPKPRIIVSFADMAQDHNGIVYQATNFLYTGLSSAHRDWAIRGEEHLHSKGISNGMTLDDMKAKYGDRFYYRERSRKHRYIMFIGDRTTKKQMLNDLRYTQQPYPKGTS